MPLAMQALKNLYLRLDEMQNTLWFRVVASIVALGLCIGSFGYLIVKTNNLDSQRRGIVAALTNQNFAHGDEHAVSFKNTGTVRINDRIYGGDALKNAPQSFFDEAGNLIAVPFLAETFLADQVPRWAPDWLLESPNVTWMLTVLCTAWLLAIVWMGITLPFVLTLAGTAIPVALFAALDRPGMMLACAGIGILTFTFVLLTRVALLALNRPAQVLAVAHTVVKEASRTRLSLVFIILLLAALPIIPLTIDADSPLRYQVQTFIARSMGLTFVLAAFLTLFLSCASVSFEIRDRQIWQLMTKPLMRVNYLLGKWIGVMTVNVIILAVSGVSIFTFIQYLRSQPTASNEAGMFDALAVTDEVLTARLSAKPQYKELTAAELRARVDDMIRNNENFAEADHVPLAVRKKYEEDARQLFSTTQRSVPATTDPRSASTVGTRDYVFAGLSRARDLGSTLTVRYKFHILGDDDHRTFPAGFIFNDDPSTARQVKYVPAMMHTFPILPEMIREDGTIKLTIVNMFIPPPEQKGLGSINFDEPDFEILYKVGSFEGNFLRAMMVSWMKLAFLAAMGVCCATFLSFAVACLLSFTVFAAAAISPFLAEALEYYYPPENVDWTNIGFVIYWAMIAFTKVVAEGLVFLLSAFGEYRPTTDLVRGQMIPWSAVLAGFLRLGLLWTGLAMLLGWIVLRRRQLAIYSGQG
jgi:hypothetical protein